MKAAIYTPYLDTLGGGERYMLSIAKVLRDEGWRVEVETPNPELLDKASERFNLNLENIYTVESVKRGDGYDACIWLSDGSVPTLYSRKNILHIQRPFQDVDGKSLINRAKFFRIKSIIVNSEYTKSWIDKEYPKESVVLYPPVDVDKFKSKRKENIICYVGRFSKLEQSKRQDVLVDQFMKLYDSENKMMKGWKLVLAGGSDVGRTEWVDELIKFSEDYPITIMENPKFPQLSDLLGKAKMFWSAAGFGVDVEKEPQKVEHFGMTVVEAMSAGVIPIIYNAGGHQEIVNHSTDGYKWNNTNQLVEYTKEIIENKKQSTTMSKQAKERSNDFSMEKFREKFLQILK